MTNLLLKSYIKYPLMALYIQAQGFFLGFAFTWTLPTPIVLGWPFYLIFDYALGAILSTLITYLVLEKWRATAAKKLLLQLYC